jgi:hypothetical protein
MGKSAEIALELAADSPGAFSSHMCESGLRDDAP